MDKDFISMIISPNLEHLLEIKIYMTQKLEAQIAEFRWEELLFKYKLKRKHESKGIF